MAYNALVQQVKVFDIGYRNQEARKLVYDASNLTSGINFYSVDAGYAYVTEKMFEIDSDA
ncbi:MAG: hypothetical protein HOC71_11820 [Candidatus Latescibacteria bacterium]|nr:hypothetical protein [Candidatus Latescibacterota bacterium]